MSREFPGYFNTFILLSLNHFIKIYPIWRGAPSCWKMKSLPGNHSLTYRSTNRYLSSISAYFIWFSHVQSAGPWTNVTLNHDLGRKFDCFFKYTGRNASSELWRTCLHPIIKYCNDWFIQKNNPKQKNKPMFKIISMIWSKSSLVVLEQLFKYPH